MASNEGEPLHTVTIHTRNLPRAIYFDAGADAHEYASSLKALLPQLRIEITDTDGGCVELQENGWSRVNN